MIKYIRNSTSLTVYLDGKPYTFASTTPQYKSVIDAIATGDENAVRTAADVRTTIIRQSEGLLTIEGSDVFFNGERLSGEIVERIMHTIRISGSLKPFANFLTLVAGNPDKRAVRELFDFIAKCNLPLTEDGHFLAFKKVNYDYTSIHDGKFMNMVGTTVWMNRADVDPNAQRTCSQGLHFCSRDYLPHFGSSGNDRILILKINPADVVAIPVDYNFSKGRAWRYDIVGELTYGDTDGLLEEMVAWVATDDTQTGLVKPLKSGWDTLDEDEDDLDDEDEDDEDEDDEDDLDDEDEDDEDEDDEDEDDAPTPFVTPMKQAAPGQSILPDNVVRDIRRLLDEGFSLAAIAQMHNISPRTVGRIRDRETYTHVR